ncbi:unnamed protein product [Ostreobium quekettii]|uniref:Cyclin N-terminal domain-containing protein n=1 Tax=Ostreobium quekettii TaxID=121088 RepID=A0A8S1J3Z9_9CHLO|nr:unnamed protein product [Ostreobium quekettii]|eukprot:evm.model.scf_677.6 EVM.evm.TU.scf_677.6   scf_677:66809-69554(-)
MRTLGQGGQNARGRAPVGRGASGKATKAGKANQSEAAVTRSAGRRARRTEEAPPAAGSKKRQATATSGVCRRAVKQTKVEEKENAAFKPTGLAPVPEKKRAQPGQQNGAPPRRPLAPRPADAPQQKPPVGKAPAGKGAQPGKGLTGKAGQSGKVKVEKLAQILNSEAQEVPQEAPMRRRSLRLNPSMVEPVQPAPRRISNRRPAQRPPASQGGISTSAMMQGRANQAAATRRSSARGRKRPSEEQEVDSPQAPASPAPDIDGPDRGDPLQCSEYAQAIYSHYMAMEASARADPNYMAAVQAEINYKMRAVLIDWIVEVHLKFKLMPETLYLAVNLIDRYLARVKIGRKRLQLVGISALMIAAKYEEIWAPEVRDFIQICDHAYTRADILAMEKNMLIELGWKLTMPTTYHFLSRFLKAAGSQNDKHMNMLAAYITELSLLSYSTLKYKFSEIAAAAVYVARKAAKVPNSYPYALQKHSTYRLADLSPCVEDLVELMKKAGKDLTKAVHRKYSNGKYHSVSTETEPPQL